MFPQFSHAAERPVKLSEHKTATSCKSTCCTLILSSLTPFSFFRCCSSHCFFCLAQLAALLPRRSHASPPGAPIHSREQQQQWKSVRRNVQQQCFSCIQPSLHCSVGRSGFQSLVGRKPLQIRHEDASCKHSRLQKSWRREILVFNGVFHFGAKHI